MWLYQNGFLTFQNLGVVVESKCCSEWTGSRPTRSTRVYKRHRIRFPSFLFLLPLSSPSSLRRPSSNPNPSSNKIYPETHQITRTTGLNVNLSQEWRLNGWINVNSWICPCRFRTVRFSRFLVAIFMKLWGSCFDSPSFVNLATFLWFFFGRKFG